MSKTVDERVVEMQFDNRNFERNVNISLSTLEKLKQQLDFSSAVKNFGEVDTAAKKLNFTPISDGLEAVKVKFSAFEVMAVTALANITNSALDTGKRLISSLSVDQITAGWGKLEQKTASVATLVSQGYDISVVEEQLERLNWFTDETSYNLTDMISNIAKFTASGQDLKPAVTAMEGIANWAALSGQNASTASHAMFQLSQAMGAGVMRKEDYKSIQNVSMDTDEFRQKALDAGVALGTLKKNFNGTYESLVKNKGAFTKSQFAEHLTEDAWFTSDVMMKVFSDYSAAVDQIYEYAEEKGITASQAIEELGDEVDEFGLKAFRAAQEAKSWTDVIDSVKDAVSTGWMNTFENLFGNYEEQRVLWTDLANAMYDVFAASGESRNKILGEWKELGGRDILIESFWNAWEGVASFLNPIREAFRDIFPEASAQQLLTFTENIRDFTSKLKLSDEQAEKTKNVFKGLFSVVDIGVSALKALISGIIRITQCFSGVAAGALNVSSAFGTWLSAVRDSAKETDIFGKAVTAIVGAIQKVIDKIRAFASVTKEKMDASGFVTVYGILKGIYDFIVKLGKTVVSVGSKMGGALLDAFRTGGINKVIDVINGGLFSAILVNIAKFTNGISGTFGGITGVLDGVSGIFDGVKGSLEAWQKSLNSKTLMNIAKALAVLAVSLVVVAAIDGDKLATALAGLTVLFTELMGSLAIFNKTKPNLKGINKSVSVLIGTSAAVLILAGALKSLSGLNLEELGVGFTGVLGLTAIVVATANGLSKVDGKVLKGATNAVIFSAAIKILASVCKDLSLLSWEELGKGLSGIGAIFAELVVLSKLTGKIPISTAVSFIAIGAALKILVSAIENLGSMNAESLAQGLGYMAASLAAVALAMKIMPSGMGEIGAGMLLVSTALLAIMAAVKVIGSMSPESAAIGVVGLSAAIIVLAGALQIMKGTLAGAAAMTVAAAAIAILTPSLLLLGLMKPEMIAASLITLAGAFAVIGVAALLLTPLVPTILALSLALAGFVVGLGLIGISMVAIGAGLAAIATGIAALITLGSGGMLVFIGAIQSAIVAVVEMIPTVAAALAGGLVTFVEVLAESAPELISAVMTLLFGLLQAIAERKLEMAEWALGFLVSVLKMLVEYTPDIVALLMQFLIGVLNAVAENLPELIEAAVNVLMAFFQGVVNALGKMDYNVLVQGLAGVGLIAAIMAALGGIALLAPAAMVGVLAAAAVVVEMAALLAAIGALAQIPGLTWLIGEGGTLLASIGEAIGGFIGGFVGGALEGVSSRLPAVGENLSAFSENAAPFFEQAERFARSGAAEGIAALAGAMLLLTANDLINGLTSWLTGGSSLEHFGESLAAFAPHMQTFLSYTTAFDPEAVKSSAEAVTALIGLCDKLPKSGGVAQWFGGEANLEAFGEPLKAFGEGIKGFGDAVNGLNAEAIQNAVPAGEALTELSKTIPKDGGIMGWLNGDLNMAQFGRELYAFGNSLKNFGDAVDGLNTDAINAAVPAGRALTELAEALPTSGGAFEWLTGSSNFTSFSEQISAFGNGLSGLSSSLVGVDPGKIEASAKAAAALSELEKALPENGGLFSGKTSLSDFGKTLATFGEGFGKYCEEIGGVDLAALDTASKATASLITISKDISAVNSDSIKNFSASLENLAQAGVKGFVDTLKNSDVEVANAVTMFVSTASAKFKTHDRSLTAEGVNAAAKLLGGASSELAKLPDVFDGAMSGTVSLIRNTRPDFYKSGEYTADGFVTGTSAKKALAEQAGREIGEAALYGLNDSLDIHSPSKETAESGENSVLGFSGGIKDNLGLSEKSGESLGGSFMDGLMDSLGISAAADEAIGDSVLGNTNAGTDTAQRSGEAVGSSFTDGVDDGMNFDSVEETVSDGLGKITKAQSDAGDEQIEIVEHVTDEMIESVERRYEDERNMLEDAYDAERNALEDLHNEKLGMYKDEYIEKLRLIDEDKYNRIKAIDDEIDEIKGKTAAEKAARKEQEQREKLVELQNDVNTAQTPEERAKAEKKLAEYKAELERERVEQERENRIAELEDEKDKIEDEAEKAAETAKEEYDTKVANENSLYEIECNNLEAQHDRRMEIIQEEYDARKQHLEHLQKLEELQNKVRSAATDEERRKAQKELDDYRDEVTRDDSETAANRAFSQTKDDLYQAYLAGLSELERKRQEALSGITDETEKQKINDDYDTRKRDLKSDYDRALRYATTDYDRAVREIQIGYENSLEARQEAYDAQTAINDARKQAIQKEIDTIDAEIAASKKVTSQKQREAQLNEILEEINSAIAAYGTLSAQADEVRQKYRDLQAKFDEEDRLQASVPALEKRRADLATEQKTLGMSGSTSGSKAPQATGTSTNAASTTAAASSADYIRVETGIIEAINTAAERISNVVSETNEKIKSSVIKAARRVSDILEFLSDEKNRAELTTIAPVQQDDAWSWTTMAETALTQSAEQIRYAAADFRTREESEFSKRALAYLGEISGHMADCDQSDVLERIYRRLDTDAPIHVTFVMSNGAKFASGVVDGIKELNKVVGKNVLADI